MFSVGLTGGIGCGKTLVSDYFSKLGAHIIDTDIISRELVKPDTKALKRIITEFGDDFLQKDGHLNRKKLQKHIFENPEAKTFLEKLLHPLILETVNKRQQDINAAYCIVVIPLLVESGLEFNINRILVVDCSVETQKHRVLQRDNMTESTFEMIFSQQASRQERLAVADDIIVNDTGSGNGIGNDIGRVYSQINVLHEKYLRLASSAPQ